MLGMIVDISKFTNHFFREIQQNLILIFTLNLSLYILFFKRYKLFHNNNKQIYIYLSVYL